jgi:hypothetical protein
MLKLVSIFALLIVSVYCGGGDAGTAAFDAKDVAVLSEADFWTQTASGNWLMEL